MAIRGSVSLELEPLVSIELGNGKGVFQSLEALVDTGFNGELAMPYALIQEIGLDYIDEVPVVLADRQQRPVRAYDGVVSWHGRHRGVVVLDIGSEPLLGMALLMDSKLTVIARPGGAVLIEEEEQP